MIEVKELEQTCMACPAQWEFRTFENRPVYVRYRWGYLSVSIGPANGNIFDAVGGYEIYGEQLGEDLDGFIEWEDVKAKLYDIKQDDVREFLESREI